MESNGIGHLFIFSKRIHDRGKRDIERRKCSQAERVTPAHIYLLLAGVCFKTEKPKIRELKLEVVASKDKWFPTHGYESRGIVKVYMQKSRRIGKKGEKKRNEGERNRHRPRSEKWKMKGNKAGYTATSCGRMGRGGNASFHTFWLIIMDQQTDGRTDGRTDGQSLL